MTKRLSCLISCLIINCLYVEHADAYFFKKISMEDGLSNLSVLSIYQDVLGRMWFGTDDGVNIYDGSKVVSFKYYVDSRTENRKLMNGAVNRIVGDTSGNIFLRNNGTLIRYDISRECFSECLYHVDGLGNMDGDVYCTVRDTLLRYDKINEDFMVVSKLNVPKVLCFCSGGGIIWLGTTKGLYSISGDNSECVLPEAEIFELYYSSLGELWVATRRNGLYRIDKSGKLRKEEVSDSRVISTEIRAFLEDEKQNVWFGTFNGLQSYNPFSDKYSVYLPGDEIGSLSHSSVFSLYRDRQNTIWVGTYYGGVNYFNPERDVFKYYAHNENGVNFPIVGPMQQDAAGKLWICTDGGGINVMDMDTGRFDYYTADDGKSILHNNVKAIEYDKNRDCFYIGTYLGGLSRYDNRRKKFYNYLDDYRCTGNGPDEIIYALKIYGNSLYIAARNGIWKLDIDTGNFSMLNSKRHFISFEIDSYGYIWLITNHSLYKAHINDWENMQQVKLKNDLTDKIKISQIREISDKKICISTLGGGIFLYDYKTQEWKQYTVRDNLLSDYCYNLVETPNRNLLITSDLGLSVYSVSEKYIRSVNFPLKGGISAVTNGCGLYAADNEYIYVGGVDGMIAFREEELLQNEDQKVYLHFQNLCINNTRILPGDESGILSQALPFTERLYLKYNQNNVAVDFFSSNYVELEKDMKFQYILEGFDEEWHFSNGMNIMYTNLSPGDYVLRLREQGDNKANEISLPISIARPWFATVWAYLLYIMIVAGTAYYLWKVGISHHLLSLSLANEKQEKERIEEMNNIKLRFFTNISHEFITPLTLIVTQLDFLLNAENNSPALNRGLLRMQNNAVKLRLLVNELLDFRKYSQGYVELKVKYIDIVGYTYELYSSFKVIAKKRNISYEFESTEENINLWIDPIQFQKVILNLLSNAFKYTSDGKSIKVRIKSYQDSVDILVSDTGCGIAPEDSEKIFERFYKVNEDSGGGIGLALTKEIVEAHGGRIGVERVPGGGSTFRINLLMGNRHFTRSNVECNDAGGNLLSEEKHDFVVATDVQYDMDYVADSEEFSEGKPSVLIIEDDKDLMGFLVDVFSRSYNVFRTEDCISGADMLEQLHPDIVIFDVSAVTDSGKGLIDRAKRSPDNISVVMLTSHMSIDKEIESYKMGVDEYVRKPFDVKLLLIKCAKLLHNLNVGNSLKARQNAVKDALVINEREQKLRDEIISIIRQNINNADFNMNTLAAELGISRSTLFTRFKELFDMTPNEFTLQLRLEESMRMLQEDLNYNVSEISYRLGFASPQYFSKSFKKYFGISPQNYRKG